MKHSLQVTLILVAVFFLAQVAGLAVTNQYIAEKIVDAETGKVVDITYSELPFNIERPEIEESKSYIFIIVAIMIGTVLVLLLVRFRSFKVWKTWFFLSVALCLTISFGAFMHQLLAISLAVGIAIWKIWRPNFIIHNLSEIFIYGGLAAIFVPIMNLFAIFILLVLISIYDMIAVWQSKHMVKMAKFQTQSQVFAGLSIPYQLPKGKTAKIQMKPHKHAPKKSVKTEEIKTAILGGGDIGFPLLFAGVLMKSVGFVKVLVVPAVVSVGLFLLLYFAKKDRFYPAMPFLSAACFVGYGVLLLI